MIIHPWCSDVPRDEAVRAAEDAVERPAVPDWREIPERVARLEAEVKRLRSVAYFLRIYVHAHQNDNRVPPHIEAAAVEMLGGGDGAAGVEVEE